MHRTPGTSPLPSGRTTASRNHQNTTLYTCATFYGRCFYSDPLFLSSSSRAAESTCLARRTGSRHDPSTGTHMRPISATASGGIILSWSGDPGPPHAVEKNEIPSRLRMPASCPNVEQPISSPSAWIMHDSVLATSRPTWRNRGFPSTRKVPDRAGRQVSVAPARFSGQSSGILASMHGGICFDCGALRGNTMLIYVQHGRYGVGSNPDPPSRQRGGVAYSAKVANMSKRIHVKSTRICGRATQV